MGALIQAGRLDRRITLLRPQVEDDGLQEREGAPVELGTVWAEAKPILDRERFAGGAVQASLAYRFLMRWSSLTSTLAATDLVRFDGRVLGIAGPPKEIGRREGVEITAVWLEEAAG